MKAPPHSPSPFPVRFSDCGWRNLSKPLDGNRDTQRNVSPLGRLTWQLLRLTLELDPGSCLKVRGPQPPPPHTHTGTQRAICCEDGGFDIKISAISASVKNHSSHISPEHEAIVVRDPESFYHIIAIRSCKIRISPFHCACLKSENR